MSSQHPPQSDVDELFDVKNNFYIRNFQQCINEAQKISPSSLELELERDIFMYRAYVAKNSYRIVLDEIDDSSLDELKPIRTLAEYFYHPDKRSQILLDIDDAVLKKKSINRTFILVAWTIYFHENNFETALQILHDQDDLECQALCVQTYLKMYRLDLAQKQLKAMQNKDDDATLTQLALAWVNLSVGSEKYQEAYYIFQEMIEKFSSTTMLLNGKALCLILLEKYPEAEETLQKCLEMDSNNPDTLINMIVLSQHKQKPEEVINRYLTQLKESHKEHPFVKDYFEKEQEFDRLCEEYEQIYLNSVQAEKA